MSHFNCLVVCKANEILDDVLEPFQEASENVNYLTFIDDTERIKGYYEKSKNEYKDFDDFLRKNGYHRVENNPEILGYFYNAGAKWDWWTVGGRWENQLILKDGTHANTALAKDVDFKAMYDEQVKEANETYDQFESFPDKEERTAEVMFKFGIQLKEGKYPTREEYVTQCKGDLFFSILKDGEWYESASMG